MKRFLLIGSMIVMLAVSCMHLDDSPQRPPTLTDSDSLDYLLQAGIDFGGDTLDDAKEIISKKKEWDKAQGILYSRIKGSCKDGGGQKLANTLHLYMVSQDPNSPALFKEISQIKKGMCQNMAWQLASTYKSNKMAQAVEERLSQSLIKSDLDEILQPKVADALILHNLKGSYTVAVYGLFNKPHAAFARAMIALNPTRASWDFMDYLSLASPEELRQLNIESVDMFACSEIFQHMQVYPVAVSHERFAHMFFYAVSRNPAFSEMARKVLELYLPRHGDYLAQLLARLPSWVQIAYVDASRRDLTPKLNLFLARLKKTSGDKDVTEEIDSVLK